MYKGRGKRGSSPARKEVMKILFIPRDLEQERRTLELEGVADIKPHVNDLMERICERLEEEEARRYARSWRGGCHPMYMGMGIDDLPFMDYDEEYDLTGLSAKEIKKLNKRYAKQHGGMKYGKRGKNRRGSEDTLGMDDYWNNRRSMYPDWRDDEDDDDMASNSVKTIKFYEDIDNEMSVREFNSLKEFEIFCTQEGYTVGSTDYNNLLNWDEIHCCLDPIDLEYGDKAVITDNSYGALYWTVSGDINKYGITPNGGGDKHRLLL